MEDERICISHGLFLTMARKIATDAVRELIESGTIAQITVDTLREMRKSGMLRAIILDTLEGH